MNDWQLAHRSQASPGNYYGAGYGKTGQIREKSGHHKSWCINHAAINHHQGIISVIDLMPPHHIRHLPVLNADDEWLGMMISSSLRKNLQPLYILSGIY